MHGTIYPAASVADIAWFDEAGEIIPAEDWNDPRQRTLVLRRAMRDEDGRVMILTWILNPGDADCRFRLPPPHLPSRVLIDSAAPDAAEHEFDGAHLTVAARGSALVYAECEQAPNE